MLAIVIWIVHVYAAIWVERQRRPDTFLRQLCDALGLHFAWPNLRGKSSLILGSRCSCRKPVVPSLGPNLSPSLEPSSRRWQSRRPASSPILFLSPRPVPSS